MFKMIRAIKQPFGEVGGAVARGGARAFGASDATVEKVGKVGELAGRLSVGALLPAALDPLGDLGDLAETAEALIDW